MIHIKKIALIGFSALMVMCSPFAVQAQDAPSNTIRINEIPMRNFMTNSQSREVEVFASSMSSATFDVETNTFFIDVFGQNYLQSRSDSEKNLIKTLDVTRNESCYLDVIFKVTNPDYTSQILNTFSDSLSFCSSPTQQDLNDDSEVNGVDFGQCIADYETSDEAERAFDQLTKREIVKLSTGQSLESLYELDLPCDFNVSRRIDALDLSKMLEAIKTSAENQK